MKEYKCVKIERTAPETEEMLNRLAKERWKVILTYATGAWIILERDKE